jgi:anaerobic ribonucleoside-triphosphate reductase activating protein
MNYYPVDVVNGEGTRNVLFVSGCEHQCKGCFAQKSWNPEHGNPFTEELVQQIIDDLKDERIPRRGFTLSGGDPLFPSNVQPCIDLVKRIKAECPDKDLWLWTGYLIEEMTEHQLELISLMDVFIDGKFVQEKHDPALYWRGSSNQRLFRKVGYMHDEVVWKEDPKMWRDDMIPVTQL